MQGRFCPKCGEQIFGLPVRPSGSPTGSGGGAAGSTPSSIPTPVPSPPTGLATPGRDSMDSRDLRPPPAHSMPPDLVVDFDDDWTASETSSIPKQISDPVTPGGMQAASGELVGKTCPYCRFPLKPGETVVVCPACQVPHHWECWQENGRCTTYGCQGVAPVAMAPGPGPPVVDSIDFESQQRRELEERARSALFWVLGGLFCCPLFTLIGLFKALGVMGDCQRVSPAGRGKAWGRAVGAVVLGGFLVAMYFVLPVIAQIWD